MSTRVEKRARIEKKIPLKVMEWNDWRRKKESAKETE